MILKNDAFRKLENFNKLTIEEKNILLNLLDNTILYDIVWALPKEDVDKTYDTVTKLQSLNTKLP